MDFLLQAMFEDIETGSKWVVVNRCYFPSDLPEAVGHPCAPESNEVNYLVYFCISLVSEVVM